ncbi:WhiB family transcriptional regulator [Streptomyces sp. NPDC047706]|uniref:WhiB family transcriptional regulator n=1 Tax=Streptomyces sp. NPDC047706 TaxID=3365486 RepID=UPI0037218D94
MDWREQALCGGADPDLFFPIGDTSSRPTEAQTALAKTVCRRCPVIRECLSWALAADPPDGVWGGTTADERRAMRQRLIHQPRKTNGRAA